MGKYCVKSDSKVKTNLQKSIDNFIGKNLYKPKIKKSKKVSFK